MTLKWEKQNLDPAEALRQKKENKINWLRDHPQQVIHLRKRGAGDEAGAMILPLGNEIPEPELFERTSGIYPELNPEVIE